jgi:hypothetical protein
VAALAVVLSLVIALLVIERQVEWAIGSAACRVRAEYELILRMPPPEAWQFGITVGLAIALAVLLGMIVGGANRASDRIVR